MKDKRQKTILLVEDEAIIAMATKASLEKFGYRVEVAHGGEEAVAAVKAAPAIDLVLMDINLGAGMDGTDAAAVILGERDLPVVFLSSHMEPEVVEKTENITSYGYVVKNSLPTVLDASIKMAFKLFAAKVSEKRKEEELLERNRYIESILDNMPIGFAANTIDDGAVRYINDRFAAIYGWPRETLTDVDRFFASVYPGPRGAELKSRVLADIRSGDPARMAWDDLEITTRTGELRYISARNIPIPDQNLMVSTVWDETRAHAARVALRESEERFRAIVDNSPDAILLTSPDGGILSANAAAERMFAMTEEEIKRRGRDGIIDAADPRLAEGLAERARTGRFSGELTFMRRNGERFPAEVSSVVFQDAEGRARTSMVIRDLSEHKRAEKARREEMEAFRGYFNMGTVGMCVTSLEKGWIEVNDRLCLMLGYSREELMRKTWAEMTHPDDLHADVDLFDQVLTGRRDSYELEKRFIHKDGRVIHTLLYATCQRNPDGSVHHMLASLVDISEQKRAERERPVLQEIAQGVLSTGDLHEFLGIVHQAIARITDAENFFVALYNKETGMFEEAYSVDKFDPYFPPSKLEKSLSKYVFRSGRPLRLVSKEEFAELVGRGEVELVGTPSLSWMGVPLMAAGEAIGVMVIQDYEKEERYSPHDLDLFVSISGQVALAVERKRWEDAVKRQLEEKSMLLKEVHHRIKNNIAAIGALISLRMQSLTNPEALAVLQDTVGRVGSMRILYDKLLLSKGYETISVKNYIETLADSIFAMFPDRARISVEMSIADLRLDPKQLFPLGLIINELLTNMLKYAFMGRASGQIRISLTQIGNRVRLVLQDDGVGLPDGFKIEKAKGFGLMLVKMLSQQLGGSFSLETIHGTRSTLEFSL